MRFGTHSHDYKLQNEVKNQPVTTQEFVSNVCMFASMVYRQKYYLTYYTEIFMNIHDAKLKSGIKSQPVAIQEFICTDRRWRV